MSATASACALCNTEGMTDFERQAAEAYEAMLELDRPLEVRRAERAARAPHAPVIRSRRTG